MNFQSKRLFSGGAAIALIFLAVGLVSSQNGTTGRDNADEKCIYCHVDTFESAIRMRYRHMPFWERQCIICHLRKGAGAILRSRQNQSSPMSGSLVSQEPLWTRQHIYPGAIFKTMDHSVELENLAPEKQYRFRIILGESKEASTDKSMVSSWFGLAPKEFAVADRQAVNCAVGLSVVPEEMISTPNITSPTPARLVVAWRTKNRMYAWLELQELDGIALKHLSGVAAPTQASDISIDPAAELHELRRAPEDLAIDACYSCHPANGLGLSHPVRIYPLESDSMKIPDILPTVNNMLTCVTCHSPHGSNTKKLIRLEAKTQLCVACHINYQNTSRSTMFDSWEK